MTDTIYTDNSKVNSALVAENERLQARVAELKFLAERLQHCAQGFYVDRGDYGHMEAIMQDYHSIMRADKAEGADNAK